MLVNTIALMLRCLAYPFLADVDSDLPVIYQYYRAWLLASASIRGT